MHRELLTNTISSAEAAADHVGSTAALTQLQLKRINFNLTVLCIQTKFHHLHTERRWKITPVIIRHSARLDIPLHLQTLNHITAGKAARLRGQLYDNTSAAGRGKKNSWEYHTIWYYSLTALWDNNCPPHTWHQVLLFTLRPVFSSLVHNTEPLHS